MSRVLKNNWQPTAPFSNLILRAKILAKIRQFFSDRGVWEVDTPLLSTATVTDPHLHSLVTTKTLYLQTSPEFAMKRLLCAGSGAIYQICKAFRDDEQGYQHNPEFTMLEWYRPGFDLQDLIQETDELLQHILQTPPAEKLTYQEAFEKYLGINPHTIDLSELKQLAQNTIGFSDDRDSLLQLLMSRHIEPHLTCTFIYDFPASQAALARIRLGDSPVAERVEVYINGMELANGFYELSDPNEQKKRFLKDIKQRKILGYPAVPYDENLIAALTHGLPDCSGIALGVDRLVMIAAKTKNIADVVSFPIDRA
ncbi:MAG: elongation factor P--(R)-beta-lysine ligase [Gammaproteobacteria bacterium]